MCCLSDVITYRRLRLLALPQIHENGGLYKEQSISVWKFQVICLYRPSVMELGKFI